MATTKISGIAFTCCFAATRWAGDATYLRYQRIHTHIHHRRHYSANVGSGFGCFSAKSTLASIILATRIHLPTLGQNGTLHLIDARDDQRHGGIVHRVHIVPSQGREDSIIDCIPASFISSSDVDDVSTTKSEVHTFDGELLSTSFTSNLHSYPTILSTVTSTTSNSNTVTVPTEFGVVIQLAHHVNGKQTSLGRVGPYMTMNILDEISEEGAVMEQVMTTSRTKPTPPMPMDIVIRVPQKFNISCFVSRGHLVVGSGKHSYDDNGKLEGDVHLHTSCGGSIVLHGKVRGHEVTLESLCEVGGSGDSDSNGGEVGRGVIHVCKSIEAGYVRIRTESPHGRVRARMLKVGSGLSVDVSSSSSSPSSPTPPLDPSHATTSKLDDDDEGASIDIGSVYIVSNGDGMIDNEARLNANVVGAGDHSNGLVRVKSSHGHLVVNAILDGERGRTSLPSLSKKRSPLIDLGGVNGSCDVLLEAPCGYSGVGGDNSHDHPDLRVHFDSMSPESISTITSWRRGGISKSGDLLTNSITMDRKLEADVRLLAVAAAQHGCVDAHSLTQSDDMKSIQRALMDFADSCNSDENIDNDEHDVNSRQRQSIFIESSAFIDGWNDDLNVPSDLELVNGSNNEGGDRKRTSRFLHRRGIEYAHGSMTNRSGEPDSRSDVRSSPRRHEGGGKINIHGAATQALHGFQGQRQDNNSIRAITAPTGISTPMPLLAVATDGIIKLETLSWFGSIARRYGLDDERSDGVTSVGGVGRQARRSPRLEK